MNFVLQRKTDLALSAMRALHRIGHMSGADLAREAGTTVSFLPQIMSPLLRAGWVASERGPNGGYRLTEAASGATLYDVIRVSEGLREGLCVLRDEPCSGDRACPAHIAWEGARQAMAASFQSISALDEGGKR